VFNGFPTGRRGLFHSMVHGVPLSRHLRRTQHQRSDTRDRSLHNAPVACRIAPTALAAELAPTRLEIETVGVPHGIGFGFLTRRVRIELRIRSLTLFLAYVAWLFESGPGKKTTILDSESRATEKTAPLPPLHPNLRRPVSWQRSRLRYSIHSLGLPYLSYCGIRGDASE